ncbi:hypothetical protein [Clostridium sp. 1001283B150210_160208_E6]|uniref:hypothetical protein n=1 Tax=Clostridium sp. 1001283B150210_160208_E6 TaxID=2787129 RepID=UPI0018ABB6D7|nr:hypothetical protein [Clostridium sp. 1001283B150210_160208_E6]
MKIGNDVKSDLRFMFALKKYDECYKKLFVLYNQEQDNVLDRCFVLRSLSLVCRNIKKIDEAKFYIQEAKNIIENENNHKTEQLWTMWAYVELFKDQLSKAERIRYYQYTKEKMIDINADNSLILGLDVSIALEKNDYEKVLDIIDICLQHNTEDDYINIKNNILNELRTKNIDIYNTAKEMENKLLYA